MTNYDDERTRDEDVTPNRPVTTDHDHEGDFDHEHETHATTGGEASYRSASHRRRVWVVPSSEQERRNPSRIDS